jgi:hypothetical protein
MGDRDRGRRSREEPGGLKNARRLVSNDVISETDPPPPVVKKR